MLINKHFCAYSNSMKNQIYYLHKNLKDSDAFDAQISLFCGYRVPLFKTTSDFFFTVLQNLIQNFLIALATISSKGI